MDCSYLNEIKGLQFMPVRANKQPIHKDWQNTKTKYDLSNIEAVGLVCGKISGNIEACDLDLKYDLTGKLFKEYKNLVHQMDSTLLSKLVVQKTVSKGYHFIYRCSFIEGNQPLARRYTTEQEKTIDPKAKVKVLLETRGEKGYIACAPTPGYELVHGSFDKIQTITPEQRSILFNCAFSFNEVLKEVVNREVKQKKQTKGLTPSEDFDERGDVVALLEKHDWTVIGRKGSKILMRRPGDTKADHSGNYDEDRKWFSVFSTSTEFEAQSPYKPYAVFTILECEGDYHKTPKVLYDLGYGEREENLRDNNITVPSIIDLSDEEDLSFLATETESDDYLHKWRTGTFDSGKTTGMAALDTHFLFKEGNLVIVNGLDNVGKSTIIWYLSILSCVLHGWKWLIFSSENKIGSIRRKLIEFFHCEPINSMDEKKYQQAKKFVIENFDIIKVSSKLYNYQDILNMYLKASKKKQYKGLMIDPYNSLKVDIPSKSKASYYDYHYEAASVLQIFAKEYNVSIYLNCHVGTQGARNKDKQGYTLAPQKEDTEMGVMFANKADEFLTIHRVTQHPSDYMNTEIHVRKVKETETGGRVTPKSRPVILTQINGVSGFIEQSRNYNPILHSKNDKQPIVDFTMPRSEQFEINQDDKPEEIPF